jgi:hypothetical protein
MVRCSVLGKHVFSEHRALTIAHSPIRRRHRAIARDHCLTRQALVGREAALLRNARFHCRRRGQLVRSFEHGHAAAGADAYRATRVSEGSAGTARCVEHGFIEAGVGVGAKAERLEGYTHFLR